jgi:hypothetical protein
MRRQVATAVVLLAGAALVLLPANPIAQPLPSWDSGVFLYTGWQILEGALPYRDVWDHKPPLIFYIDALGLALGNGTRWGVWALELVSLWSATLLAFFLTQRFFGVWGASYATLAFLLNAFLAMDGGNYTTEYALPFQFALLWLVATSGQNIFSARRAFVMGALGGILFWLKQNDIGIPLAIGLYLVIWLVVSAEKRGAVGALAGMAGGTLLVSAVVLMPFVIQGALAPFWDAAFRYNFVYVDDPLAGRVAAALKTPLALPALGVSFLAAIGWLAAVWTLWLAVQARIGIFKGWADALDRRLGSTGRDGETALVSAGRVRLLAVTVLALPMETLLVTTSDNAFDHYYLALLPVMTIFCAFSVQLAVEWWAHLNLKQWVRVAVVAGMVVLLLLAAVVNVTRLLPRFGMRNVHHAELVAFIQQNSAPHDDFLIWGGEARIYLQAQRRPPTRYVYTNPLRREMYARTENVEELLNDIEEHRPNLIADTNKDDGRFFDFAVSTPHIESHKSALLAQYRASRALHGWQFYERVR